MSTEERTEQVARELIELLNEIRVLLPGVSALFAFMLAVPFTQRFESVGELERRIFFFGFLCSAISMAFLSAPSVYHRLHWRRDVRDKDEMLRTSNRLAIVGVVFLALAMIATVFVVTRVLFERELALAATVAMTVVLASLWFVLPLSRRARDRRGP
jgi:predicted membrane channel-forming protein YqfA (hemolysin III family)